MHDQMSARGSTRGRGAVQGDLLELLRRLQPERGRAPRRPVAVLVEPAVGPDMGKFYAASLAMMGGSGAIRASARAAYAMLKTRLDGLTTERRVLARPAGWRAITATGRADWHHRRQRPVQGDGTRHGVHDRRAGGGAVRGGGAVATQTLAETGNSYVNANARPAHGHADAA